MFLRFPRQVADAVQKILMNQHAEFLTHNLVVYGARKTEAITLPLYSLDGAPLHALT